MVRDLLQSAIFLHPYRVLKHCDVQTLWNIASVERNSPSCCRNRDLGQAGCSHGKVRVLSCSNYPPSSRPLPLDASYVLSHLQGGRRTSDILETPLPMDGFDWCCACPRLLIWLACCVLCHCLNYTPCASFLRPGLLEVTQGLQQASIRAELLQPATDILLHAT